MAARLLAFGDKSLPRSLGGKAAGLRWLAEHGYRVPPTWVIVAPTTEPAAVADALAAAIEPDRRWAVRSSANVEDGGDVSYAGQFLSRLDVSGARELVDAVVDVVASANAPGVTAYRLHQGDDRPIEMAVIVQEMIEPVVSGVAFSKNPVTGLSETVVEAVVGSGDLLHAEGSTPARWVHRWGDFLEEPASPPVERAVVRSVVEATAEIAHAYGGPVDLEWVFDGARVWWVQIRPITGLEGVTIYSRRISKEVMPGIIKPLVWSVNVPMVNAAWIRLFEEALGDVALEPDDLAKSFGYRSYFNMTAIGEIFAALGMPRESLELLLGLPAGSEQPRFAPTATTMRKTPRLVAMAVRKARYGREVERALPELDAEYRRFAATDLAAATDDDLLADIEELRRIGVRAAELNVVAPLLANVYGALLRSLLARRGVDLAEVALSAGDDDLDPNRHLDALAARFRLLDDDTRTAAAAGGYAALPDDLAAEVDAFLERFGHFSDSGNDFSVPAWREMPDTVVAMAASRTSAERTVDRRDWDEVASGIPALQRAPLEAVARRAAEFIGHRDRVSSLYTFGYGLFRDYFLELGRRLSERGILGEADDVMYLTIDELSAVLAGSPLDASDLVEARKAEIAAVADVELPDIIYGDDFVVEPSADTARSSWHGTPTARGHHRGRVRVVRGIADFGRVEDGDVLAIPFSDAGWTPLFAKAGAVVAESGGMLSHSSIVAREYGIPCVVSVSGAMQIPDGAVVAVDGYQGMVTLEVGP